MCDPGSSTIRRCGLVGECVSLWERTLRPSSYLPEDSLLLSAFRLRWRTQHLLQHHACLDAVMLPTVMILD